MTAFSVVIHYDRETIMGNHGGLIVIKGSVIFGVLCK